jgi:hypothetical protein
MPLTRPEPRPVPRPDLAAEPRPEVSRPDRQESSDRRHDRLSDRTLLTAIAIGVLTLGALLGVIYLGLWQGASEDLSRLLPASTRTHAMTDNLLLGLQRTLSLGAWRDPAKMRVSLSESGLWSDTPQADLKTRVPSARPCIGCNITDLGGVPIDVARDLLLAMDGFEVALVPAGDESALLVFVELRDPAARKRVLARLRPHLETVDREVGFRIDRLRPRPWASLIGFDIDPPRLVDMEPWLILSWGSPVPLEELLEARVGGRFDALHRRSGFSRLGGMRRGEHPLRLVVDARSAWQIVSGGEPRAGGLIEYLDLMTLTASIVGTTDPLELLIEISDRDLGRRLSNALSRGPHPLLERVPQDALLALALRGDDLPGLANATALLASQLARDFGAVMDEEPALTTLLSGLGVPPGLEELLSELPAAPGEIVFTLVPGALPRDTPELIVLLRSSTPDALENALATAIPRWLGDGWAHGEVTRLGERLYIERPHGTGTPITWRLRDGVVELATSVETLERLASNPTLTLSTLPLGIDTTSGVAALFRPSLLATTHPLSTLIRDRLRDDFLIVVTLDANLERLTLRSNTGLWTLLGALASATPDELDTLMLGHLTPECRQAYEAFCKVYPAAAPCQPLAFGRTAHIAEVCRGLRAAGTPPR